MYKNKRDVDKHVLNLSKKLNAKEILARSYSIARLYYEVGDFANCQKYAEQYLILKEDNAAAHKLLGLASLNLNQKKKALEHFITSFNIDPSQANLILDICGLIADEEVSVESGDMYYWYEKVQSVFPKHPIMFRLQEKLVSCMDPDPEAIVNLLKVETSVRPTDSLLHIRLLKHYLQMEKNKEAFDHCFDLEFGGKTNLLNNFIWYETALEVLKVNADSLKTWQYQTLLLTVKERICVLSLSEITTGTLKSITEINQLLFQYDKAIENVSKSKAQTGYTEIHENLIEHHRGQFALHAATFMLKKAKNDQLDWKIATKVSIPLMLIAWHCKVFNHNVDWLKRMSLQIQNLGFRWHLEGAYRCSQSGHYLLALDEDKMYMYLDELSLDTNTNWRNTLFKDIFPPKHFNSIASNSFFMSNKNDSLLTQLPQKHEVETHDLTAQAAYSNSLHHFVWILSNYKEYANFKLTVFDMLPVKPSSGMNCGPETLNRLDIYAFLYASTLTNVQGRINKLITSEDSPNCLPASITDMICTTSQMKWWDCSLKFSRNEFGKEFTDVRATISRGIEVVRCIDNHGLDPELLCMLGRVFSKRSTLVSLNEEKIGFESRAFLYYSSALLMLEKFKTKGYSKNTNKQMFQYNCKELTPDFLNSLIEECKLFIGIKYLHDGDYATVSKILSGLNSPESYFYLAESFKRMALEEISNCENVTDKDSKYLMLLSKSKHFATLALDKVKLFPKTKPENLLQRIEHLLSELENHAFQHDLDLFQNFSTISAKNEIEAPISGIRKNNSLNNSLPYGDACSTPKPISKICKDKTTYIGLDSPKIEYDFQQRIENEIKNLHKKEDNILEFMNQTKFLFDRNCNLGNQMNIINSNVENIIEQFKLFKISLDYIKNQTEECRIECKKVEELKKQVNELKNEISQIKSDSAFTGNNLYNLENESENANFSPQFPFTNSMTNFGPRLLPPFPIPPNPYQICGQNWINMYNQYPQLLHSSVPGSSPMFDSIRAQQTYSGIYPIPDQIYGEVQQTPSTLPSAVSSQNTTMFATSSNVPKLKENLFSMPSTVISTNSLPLGSATSAPIFSITTSKNIKETAHNYQIPLPVTNESKDKSAYSLTNLTDKSDVLNPDKNSSDLCKPAFVTNHNLESSALSETGFPFESSQLSSANSTFNKSRTLSEKSNASVDNYDPCPNFKPLIPLPDEVKVKTGEENESPIFSARAKLFRFVNKEWKERGIGIIKLLRHKTTNKIRLLMRREQIHKVCANHILTSDIEIKPMPKDKKSYFWVANDFAEETVILEKFCIRFKTEEIGSQFYEIFKKSCLESKMLIPKQSEAKPLEDTNKKEIKTVTISQIVDAQLGKAMVGGFTFKTKPTIKDLTEETKQESLQPNPSKLNLNIFSSINLNTNTQSPNIFNANNIENVRPKISTKDEVNGLDDSDKSEEFVPTVEFQPIVPLPALVEHKTGEEEENVLFEQRAKLLRFDSSNKEWKERGVGNIKILANKDNIQKIRLLMRREPIMKVCCNHALTKDITFQKMPNMNKAVTWCAKDFSDGTLISETFCLRFKTENICDDFLKAIKSAQETLNCDAPNSAEKSLKKSDFEIGFGDKFKPKEGSWECKACYTNNLDNYEKCACCENPRLVTTTIDSKVSNETKSNLNQSEGLFKIKLGIPDQTDTTVDGIKTVSSSNNSWGDKFKPKDGTWECQLCCVRNESVVEHCIACGQQKKSDNKNNTSSDSSTKFKFGMSNLPDKSKSVSIFDGNSSHKFNFQMSVKPDLSSFSKSFLDNPIFKKKDLDVSFSQPSNFFVEDNKQNGSVVPKYATSTEDKNTKNTTKDESVSPSKDPGGESDVNDSTLDEDSQAHFSPIIPLPDQVEVITGEEDEEVLYQQRARLFRFVSSDWKERGIGMVKLLKHKTTGKLRVIMRRDQVHKICLNHNLTKEVQYSHKDDKSWLFSANDFSEGELQLQTFTLRFKNKEIALEFLNAVKKALKQSHNLNDDTEDVVFVSETLSDDKDKEKARKLMLPENFYTYKLKEDCTGCRGCDKNDADHDDDDKQVINNSNEPSSKSKNLFKNIFNSSPSNSLYGTPMNANRTRNSIFGTPLELFDSRNKSNDSFASVGSSPATVFGTNENTYLGKSNENSFSDSSQNKSNISFGSKEISKPTENKENITLTPQNLTVESKKDESKTNDPKSIFKNAVLSLNESNKLSLNNKDETNCNETQNNEPKSLFGSMQKSNFLNKNSEANEVKSIFGGGFISSKNIFENTTHGGLFGMGSLKKEQSLPNNTDNTKTTQHFIIGEQNSNLQPDLTKNKEENKNPMSMPILSSVDNNLSFAALSSKSTSGFNLPKNPDFKWEGAGQRLFSNAEPKDNKSNQDSKNESSVQSETAEEEYDPHYEPIVPLPDKIVVTTGEEDEEKIYNQRCKLFRYDESSKEWKERGVGEIKILYHPERKTYRFLLRREQVHKAVLNMVLFPNFSLVQMKHSDKAWTWCGVNYAENPAGNQELLAVRFKTIQLANEFKDITMECVKKLQAAVVEDTGDEGETICEKIPPLRQPKNLEK